MTPITIRQAVLADLDTLTPLFDSYRQFYGRASDVGAAREFLRERFNHGESVLFLACAGSTAVGFTQLYPGFSSVALARVFVLNDLFVCEQARRQRVGANLLEAALTYARSLGAVRVSLTTAIDNINAQALYEAAGWQRDGQYLPYHYLLGS